MFNAVRTHIVRIHAINLYTPLEVRAVQNAVEKFLHLTNCSRVHLLLLFLSSVHPLLLLPLFYLCFLTLAFCLCAYVFVRLQGKGRRVSIMKGRNGCYRISKLYTYAADNGTLLFNAMLK